MAQGYDGGKKIKGRKRVLLVDTLGLTHGIDVVSAGEHETVAALPLLERGKNSFPRLKKILADLGFSSDPLRRFVFLQLGALLEISQKDPEK